MAKIICLSCFNELSRYDKIFSCSRKHNFCAPCGKSMHLQCEVCLRIFLFLRSHFPIKNSEDEIRLRSCVHRINKSRSQIFFCCLLKIENKEISCYVWTLESYFMRKKCNFFYLSQQTFSKDFSLPFPIFFFNLFYIFIFSFSAMNHCIW